MEVRAAFQPLVGPQTKLTFVAAMHWIPMSAGPFVFAEVKNAVGLDRIIAEVLSAWEEARREQARAPRSYE